MCMPQLEITVVHPSGHLKQSNNFRVKFKFGKFGFYGGSSFYSALEIGDGIFPGYSTRLAHFRGLALPSDVISISTTSLVKSNRTIYPTSPKTWHITYNLSMILWIYIQTLKITPFSSPFAGHYFIDHESQLTITKDDINTTYGVGDNSPDWTFNSSKGFRINFEFQRFSFYWSSSYYSALEIGDGLTRGTETRLAHFRGLDKPNDVTSISNAAWMRVYAPYLFPNLAFPYKTFWLTGIWKYSVLRIKYAAIIKKQNYQIQ